MRVRLSDLCDVGIGRTPPRKQSWWFSRYCGNKWVSIKDMGLSNKYLSITSECLTDDAVEKFNVLKIERGTIILSFKLTIGRIAIVSEDMYSNEAIAQLPIKQSAANLADRDYLYYKLKYYDYDKLGSTSSIATAINSKMLANMEIDLPDLATQKKIADTLSAFDDKIELNRQMNETLEEMGRALFRHYFIDNPEAKNWPDIPLDEVATFTNGLAMQKYPAVNTKESLPVIKIREMQRGVMGETDRGSNSIPDRYIVRKGDLLFSWSGTLMTKFWDGPTGALNQHLFKVESNRYPKWFYYYWINSYLNKFVEIARDKATTMGHIQRRHLHSSMIRVPDNETMRRLDMMFGPIVDESMNCMQQCVALSNARDALANRLI